MCPLPILILAAAQVQALVKWISERNRRSMSSEMNASCARNVSCANREQREGWWPCPKERA